MSQIPPDIQALADEEAARLAAEWGQWVASSPILWEGRLAYLPGHPVPASNVEQYGYDTAGLVRRADEPAPADTGTAAKPAPAGQTITATATPTAQPQTATPAPATPAAGAAGVAAPAATPTPQP